ncbi:MAG: hypothetical protein U1A23_04115 [Candidatus Sungbacteria bacterium]|nr:hypothetical protein [bacterium]MDZ4286089.1 hypothetical protein [Candidatus Sungbacteria bacterium]
MKAPWISMYETRKWTVCTVLFSSPAKEALDASLRRLGDEELFVCGAESEAAARHWGRNQSVTGLLFYDLEQLWAMELDKVYGVSEVGVLTTEWNGHPPGSLVMSVFRGVTEQPPFITVGIAKK